MTETGLAAAASQGPDPVRTEHTGAFVRLSQLWLRRNHFSLVLAAADYAGYRDALINRLTQLGPAARVDLGPEDPPDEWLRQVALAHANGASRVHLCLPLDKPRGAKWWQQANVLRERLADALPGTQVLWLTDTDIDTAAHQAPDLWNWREAVFAFTTTVAIPLPPLAGSRFYHSAGMAGTLVEERLTAIEKFLADAEAADISSASLHLEAARAYQRLGQLGKSAAHAQHAAQQFSVNGDESSAAQAKAELADVLVTQGQPDLAIQLLRQEVLPVYEKLGDVRSRAVTMGGALCEPGVARKFRGGATALRTQ